MLGRGSRKYASYLIRTLRRTHYAADAPYVEYADVSLNFLEPYQLGLFGHPLSSPYSLEWSGEHEDKNETRTTSDYFGTSKMVHGRQIYASVSSTSRVGFPKGCL